jgi:hypothetical protein
VFDEAGVLIPGEYTLAASAEAFGDVQADFSDGTFFVVLSVPEPRALAAWMAWLMLFSLRAFGLR